MATTSPTPPGAAHELRLVPLFLLTEPPDTGSPENVVGIVVFTVGHRRSSPPIRRPQGFLELAGHPYGTVVSPRAFSPSPRSQSPPLASLDTRAESSVSPAMAPPWPEPEPAAPARVVVLLTSPGARSLHQILPTCPTATARAHPSFGCRHELVSGEYSVPQPLLPTPLDADEHGLPPGGRTAPNRSP
nr:uncharacterized protein LOC109744035 [Aegilops tauschii subsp. strangulata]